MADGLIELGESHQRDERDQRWQMPQHQRRRAAIAVLVLVLLGFVAGSAGRSPRLSDLLWSEPDVDYVTMGQGTLYTVRSDESRDIAGSAVESASSVVEARAPDTGDVRWQLRVDGLASYVLDTGHGTALVMTQSDRPPPDGKPAPQEPERSTLLVRVASGQVIARTSGEPWAAGDGRLLVVSNDADCGRAESCQRLVSIDLGTGAEVWTLALGYRTTFGPDNLGQRFTSVDIGAEAVQIRSQATGEVVAAVPLPAGFGQYLDTDRVLSLVGDWLTIGHREPGRAVIEGRSLLPGGGSWSVTLPADHDEQAKSSWLYAGACAGLLCVDIDGTTALIDPATGAVRGRTDGDVLAGGYGVADGAAGPTTGGHENESLASVARSSERPGEDNGLSIVRTSDASVVARFARGIPVFWIGGRGRYLVAQENATQTAFTIVDWRGHRRAIGQVSGGQLACQAYDRILVCDRPSGVVRVWRLPSADELAAGLGDGRS